MFTVKEAMLGKVQDHVQVIHLLAGWGGQVNPAALDKKSHLVIQERGELGVHA